MTPSAAKSTAPSWGYTDLMMFISLAVLAMLLAQLLVLGAAKLFHFDHKDRTITLLPSQLLLYVMLLLILYAIIKLQYGRQFWSSLAWVDFGLSPSAALFSGVLLAFAISIAALLLRTPDVDTPLKHLLSRRGTAIEFGIVGTTIGPLCEELVFRGFMQPLVVHSLGRALGILLTAFVFGALHLSQNAFTWQSGVLITVAGLAFGWVREVTGSTKASTLMHAAYNFTFFVALLSQLGHVPS